MSRIITGIEISPQGIHAVEISVQRKTIEILRFMGERVQGNGVTPEALSLFVSEYNIQADGVVTSVPGDMLITRKLSVPFRERSRIDKVIPYEVEPLVPFPIQDLDICYRILHQEKGKSDLLVYAIPRNLLDQRTALFEAAGIPVRMITVPALASANTLIQIEKIKQEGTYLHLHVASNYSMLSIYENGVLNHLQRLTWGEENLLGKLQAVTGLDPVPLSLRLEKISPSEASDLQQALKKESPGLTPHIRKVIRTYSMRSQQGPPLCLYVTGAAPGLPLILALLEEDLSIRTESPDPVSHFSHEIEDLGGSGIHAPLGMALMEAGRDELNCTFRRKKFSFMSKVVESKQELRYAGIITAVLILALAADFFTGIQAKEYRFKELQKESRRIFQETFPDVKNVVNELEQMKLKIKEVEKQNEIFERLFGEKPSPLQILNGLSANIPQEIELSITDLTIDEKSIRFLGWTDSFNSVNLIEQELKKTELFKTVSVSNAKVGKEKNRINFQMKITLTDT